MCNQVEFFAQKREEETWAQLAARVPPTGFIDKDGTPGVSRIMMLTAENSLRNTISAPQIAARVLRQTLFHPKNDRQVEGTKTLNSPTRRFEMPTTRQPIPNLLAHCKGMSEEHPRRGDEVRRAANS